MSDDSKEETFDRIIPIAQVSETQRLGVRVTGTSEGFASVGLGVIGKNPDGSTVEGSEEIRVEEVPGESVSYEVVGRAGPAKVNTREFQSGWDRIFGEKNAGKT